MSYIDVKIDITGLDPALVVSVIPPSWDVLRWVVTDTTDWTDHEATPDRIADWVTQLYPSVRAQVIVRVSDTQHEARVLSTFWGFVAEEQEADDPRDESTSSPMDTDPAVQALIDAGWLGEWNGPVTVADLVNTVKIVRDTDKEVER